MFSRRRPAAAPMPLSLLLQALPADTADTVARAAGGLGASAISATDVLTARLHGFVTGFIRLIPNLISALIVFGLFFVIARLVRRGLRRATDGHRSQHLGLVLGRIGQALILFVGLMLAVSIVVPGVGGADLIQLLGVGGVAIGFAFRDILQNFVAGVLILLSQPFRIGDQIVFKDFEGTVENIETRATLIRTYDGTRVIIPNGELFTNAVRVNTAFDARRSQYDIGIGYGDALDDSMDAFREAIGNVEGVLADPAPDTLAWSLDESDVKVRVRWWTHPTRADVVKVQSDVLLAIRRVAAERGIDLPFPTQVVLFHDQTEESDGDRRRQREGWPAPGKDGGDPPRPRWIAQSETGGDGAPSA